MINFLSNLNLIKLLHGERPRKVPFWEVWFAMTGFVKRRYDCNMVKAAKELGWDALCLGAIDTNVHFIDTTTASDGTSHYSGGSLIAIDQFEKKVLPDWDKTIMELLKKRKLYTEQGIASWVILPWCFHAVATSMGLNNFALRCYDDINFIHTAFEWVESRNRRAIDIVVKEVRPDFVLFDGDCAYKNGLMINPGMFRELTYDKTLKTVSHLRKLDIPYTFHSDGKMDDFTAMLIELGFSAVHGCEKAANNLGYLVDKFGDDICLVGNMDVVFLSQASVAEVRREAEEMLKIGSRKGRFAASCNTSPMDYIPDENYLAMADVIKHF